MNPGVGGPFAALRPPLTTTVGSEPLLPGEPFPHLVDACPLTGCPQTLPGITVTRPQRSPQPTRRSALSQDPARQSHMQQELGCRGRESHAATRGFSQGGARRKEDQRQDATRYPTSEWQSQKRTQVSPLGGSVSVPSWLVTLTSLRGSDLHPQKEALALPRSLG